jgi:hypothetical protein
MESLVALFWRVLSIGLVDRTSIFCAACTDFPVQSFNAALRLFVFEDLLFALPLQRSDVFLLLSNLLRI